MFEIPDAGFIEDDAPDRQFRLGACSPLRLHPRDAAQHQQTDECQTCTHWNLPGAVGAKRYIDASQRGVHGPTEPSLFGDRPIVGRQRAEAPDR